MTYNLRTEGFEKLERKVQHMSSLDWEDVVNKQLTDMFNRGARPPGTPVREGQLRQSRETNFVSSRGGNYIGEFGYSVDYAPHVEFGHRTKRGYVAGQRYLQRNVETQSKIFYSDMKERLRS